MTTQKIQIDIVSDVVCPWCYIGKRRLETAIAGLQDKYEFQLRYLPFELNPEMPQDGAHQKEYLTKKFGGEDRYQQITEHVTRMAEEEGLHFDFEAQAIAPNTFEAHRIIWWAEKKGLQLPVAEAFFSAYFEKGIDLTKTENLVHIATQAGLEAEELNQFLASGEGKIEVKQLQSRNRQMGVTGVPFYIINQKFGISGAQPAEVFAQAFEEAVQQDV
jgi:predicted DsbA family dithiol-disulfide isomerase